jgi:hypothetical protein
MKNILHYAVGGAIAAAMMVLLKLLLTQQPALVMHYHYPPYELVGQDGLMRLARVALFGAGYGAAYGLLLQALLPGGIIVGSLALGCVPTLVEALVLPLREGHAAIKDPWTLLWMFAHWVFYALCLIFIVGAKKGSKGGGKKAQDD